MTKSTCSVDGCDSDVLARALCRNHYRETLARKNASLGNFCYSTDCVRTVVANGLCLMHYKRMKRTGTLQKQQRGLGESELLPGYTRVMHDGYVRLVRYQDGVCIDRVMEHRVVMERVLGRSLLPDENVHHINGVRDDNRPDNLELWVVSQPAGQRPADLVEWATEILNRYGSLKVL